MEHLRGRAAFQAVAGGRRVRRRGFVLQAAASGGNPQNRSPRVGFAVSRKTGNAVVRNRIRRRLKEAVRLAAPGHAEQATDYLVIGRRAALALPFDRLVADLLGGLAATRGSEGSQTGSR